MKIPVTYADGITRGGCLKTHSLDPLKLRNWTNPADPFETMWELSAGAFYLVRVPNRELTELEREGSAWVYDATALSLAPRDAFRWFQGKALAPPQGLEAFASSSIGGAGIHDAARTYTERRRQERAVERAWQDALRATAACAEFVESKPAGAMRTVWGTRQADEPESAWGERHGGLPPPDGEHRAAWRLAFREANAWICAAWVERHWLPACEALRATGAAERIAETRTESDVHEMVHRLFVDLLTNPHATPKHTATSLEQLREELAEHRLEVSTYFDWLSRVLRQLPRDAVPEARVAPIVAARNGSQAVPTDATSLRVALQLFLEVLWRARATSKRSVVKSARLRTELGVSDREIEKRASELRRLQLVASVSGAGGGRYLTEAGQAACARMWPPDVRE